MKDLDIIALRMYVAAIDGKSLSKAAEAQDTVISAVSKRISALEGFLGKTLLVRHGRGVILPLFFVVLSSGVKLRFYIDSRASVLRIPSG